MLLDEPIAKVGSEVLGLGYNKNLAWIEQEILTAAHTFSTEGLHAYFEAVPESAASSNELALVSRWMRQPLLGRAKANYPKGRPFAVSRLERKFSVSGLVPQQGTLKVTGELSSSVLSSVPKGDFEIGTGAAFALRAVGDVEELYHPHHFRLGDL